MDWRWPGDKPFSELMVISLLPHTCITPPQWVKLRTYGPDTLDCNIASYLSNRKQRVEIGNAWSENSNGVSQGSNLALLLFNVFINNLHLFINNCTLYSYADDNSFSCVATEIKEAISNLQMDGSKTIPWFTNAGTSKYISVYDNFTRWFVCSCTKCTVNVLNENTGLVSQNRVQGRGIIYSKYFSLHVCSIYIKRNSAL